MLLYAPVPLRQKSTRGAGQRDNLAKANNTASALGTANQLLTKAQLPKKVYIRRNCVQ